MGPVASGLINSHVKFLILSAKDDEDAKRHLLHSNDWMTSQGVAEEAKCGRFS